MWEKADINGTYKAYLSVCLPNVQLPAETLFRKECYDDAHLIDNENK